MFIHLITYTGVLVADGKAVAGPAQVEHFSHSTSGKLQKDKGLDGGENVMYKST